MAPVCGWQIDRARTHRKSVCLANSREYNRSHTEIWHQPIRLNRKHLGRMALKRLVRAKLKEATSCRTSAAQSWPDTYLALLLKPSVRFDFTMRSTCIADTTELAAGAR